jgi:hypothetical protein
MNGTQQVLVVEEVLVVVIFANGDSFEKHMKLHENVRDIIQAVAEQKGDHVGSLWIIDDMLEESSFLKPSQTINEIMTCVQTDRELRLGVLLEDRVAWDVFSKGIVKVSEDGLIAAMDSKESEHELVMSGYEMTEGRHYWEVELREQAPGGFFVGVTRPKLNPKVDYAVRSSMDAWFVDASNGLLYGNSQEGDESPPHQDFDESLLCLNGKRIGMLLDLDEGSLLFFKNGKQHGPGYPTGSVTGPVVHALSMWEVDQAGRLILDAAWPRTCAKGSRGSHVGKRTCIRDNDGGDGIDSGNAENQTHGNDRHYDTAQNSPLLIFGMSMQVLLVALLVVMAAISCGEGRFVASGAGFPPWEAPNLLRLLGMWWHGVGVGCGVF